MAFSFRARLLLLEFAFSAQAGTVGPGNAEGLSNIFWLGVKELRSFLHDYVLLGLVFYTFSLAVMAQSQSNTPGGPATRRSR